jgi:hypothetical protein
MPVLTNSRCCQTPKPFTLAYVEKWLSRFSVVVGFVRRYDGGRRLRSADRNALDIIEADILKYRRHLRAIANDYVILLTLHLSYVRTEVVAEAHTVRKRTYSSQRTGHGGER